VKRRYIYISGSVFSVFLSAAMLAANANASDQSGASGVASESVAMEPIVVTAQRREELEQNVPFSITTATAIQLEQAGVTNMMDLQKVVPGLVMTGTGAWSMPSMRGVSTTVSGPTNDSPIAIYVDGIYQPNELGGFFDLPDIERVEIDKGPQGTLFGRNATGGAIQIFTAAPSFTPKYDVSLSAGAFPGAGSSHSAGDFGLKGFISGPIADNLAGSFSLHWDNTTGYLDDVVRNQPYGKINDVGARAKLLYNLNDSAKFVFSAFYDKRDDDHAGSGVALGGVSVANLWPGSIVTGEPWQITADQRPFVITQTWGASLRGDVDTGIGTFTSLTSFYDVSVDADINTDLSYSSLAFWTMGPGVDFKLPNYFEHAVSQEFYLASKKWGRFSFQAGVNAYLDTGFQPGLINDFQQSAPFPQLLGTGPSFAFSALIKAQAYAAYSEVYYDVTDRLHLIGGFRFSDEHKTGNGGYTCCDTSGLPRYASKVWTEPIFRASARYDVSSTSNVYFTFSQGFKSGIIPYSDFSGSTASPEKINSYEVGYKGRGANWQTDVAAFYYDYKDQQVQTFDNIVSQVTNAAKSSIAGFDVDGTYQPTDAFDVRAAATWLPREKYDSYNGAIAYNYPLTANPGLTQYTISLTGADLIKTPKLTSSLTGTYRSKLNGGDLTTSLSAYESTRFENDIAGIIPTKGYATLAAEIAYQPTQSHFRYSVWGRNLTNAAYVASTVSGAPTPYVLYGPPLEFGVAIKYSH
jgi:iron complex outermembrane receptor protein